jgi:hypothetical protein
MRRIRVGSSSSSGRRSSVRPVQGPKARHESFARRQKRRGAGQAGRQVDQPHRRRPQLHPYAPARPGPRPVRLACPCVPAVGRRHRDRGRIIAGWPALALLLAVNFCLASSVALSLPRQRLGNLSSRTPTRATTETEVTISSSARRAPKRPVRPRLLRVCPPSRPSLPPVALPAARAVANELSRDGQSLTRDALAARMRQHGHPIRDASLTPLLSHLRGEPAGQLSSTT